MLGSPRSGSTWLFALLAEFDAVVPVNEPLIGWFLGPFMSDLPGFTADGVGTDEFTLRRVQARNPAQFFNDEFADVWLPHLGEMMRARFLAHAQRYPARVPLTSTLVVVKEPNGSQSADVLMAALPRSRFLFLLRDGRDVVASELAANGRDGWVGREFPGFRGITADERLDFVVQSAKKWLWRTEVVQGAYECHTGPKLLARYEDLLDRPEHHLRLIVEWLGLDVARDRLAAAVEKHAFERIPVAARGSNEFFRSASPGSWRRDLRPLEQDAVQAVLGDKLCELGYA